MSTLEELVKEFNEEMESKKAEKTATDYTLPCQPGSEFWYIENFAGSPFRVRKGEVKMVGFTSDSIQVMPIDDFSKLNVKSYIWGKTAFASKEEAETAFNAITERSSYSFFKAFKRAATPETSTASSTTETE